MTQAALASPMPRRLKHHPVTLGATSALLPLAKPHPRLRVGHESVASTVLTLVLFATYLGIGALAHDSHFSLGWVLGSTLLVWAGPAQIILISTLGSGATAVQAAIAVTVSAVRLFPMVVSVLPLMNAGDQAASSGAGDAFHRRHPVGRVLPAAAAGPARGGSRSRMGSAAGF